MCARLNMTGTHSVLAQALECDITEAVAALRFPRDPSGSREIGIGRFSCFGPKAWRRLPGAPPFGTPATATDRLPR